MLSLKMMYESPLGALITNLINKSDKYNFFASPSDVDDPLQAEYIRSIPRCQRYKGVLLQGYLVPPSVLQGIEDFEIKPDDVFVISYPKSGTTWTEEILSLIYNDGDVKKVENKSLISRVEHLEVGRPFGHLCHLKKRKSPRLMATHLPYRLLPKELREAKCKVIYVARNPKDNAVSYYHYHRMCAFLGNYKGSWERFLHHYMEGHLVYGSWFDHILPYWKFHLSHPDKVLFISFEELKMDLSGMIRQIAEFVGHPLTAEAVDRITSHCTFEKMRSNSMVNREVLPLSDLFDMSKSKFMRKGIIGDWKNHFTEEENEEFDKLYKEKMKGSGLDLAFEPEDAQNRMIQYGHIILKSPHVPTENINKVEDSNEDIKITAEVKSNIMPLAIKHEALLKAYNMTVYNTYVRHQGINCYIPRFQLHIQPDLLALDTV